MGNATKSQIKQYATELSGKIHGGLGHVSTRHILTVAITGGTLYVLVNTEPAKPNVWINIGHLVGTCLNLGTSPALTLVGREHITRFQFAWIQCKFFNAYSMILATGAFLSFSSFLLMHPMKTWADQDKLSGIVMGCSLMAAMLNMSLVTPIVIDYSKKLVESQQHHSIEDSSASMKELHAEISTSDANFASMWKSFRRGHVLSSCFTMTVIGSGIFQLAFIATKLQRW